MCGQHNLAVGDEIFAPDMIDHNPTPEQFAGVEGQKQVLQELWVAFPDFHTEIDGLIAEGDQVVLHWTGRDTHTGDFYGTPAIGRKIVYTGIDILHTEQGKIIELWWGGGGG